ncbi:unnamed protein product [Orchesella dallaii]|uniref:Uncharacterized protein n=1 Tax=Orchesella dallaii TaxID=48710 RepID=A0ABP1R1D1_9HEXA
MHAPLDLMNEAHMHKSKGITITKDRKTTGNTASDTGESQENETAPVAERPSTHLRPLSILSSLSFLKLRSSDARQRTNGFQNGTCELTEEEVVLFQEKLNTTTEYTNPIEKTRKAEINPNKLHDNLKAHSNTQNAHVVKDFYANVLSSKPNTTYKNHSNNLDSEEVSTQAQQSKSGYNQVNSEQVSNIYGSVGSTVGFTGSFALYNSDRKCDKGRDLMMKEQAVSLHNFDGDLKLARNTAGVNPPKSWWRFEGGTFLEVRASHLLKLVCLLMIITIVITFTFHSRIRQLEVQKAEVLHELNGVKLHLEILIERMDTVVSLAIPAKSTRATGINFDKGEEYTRHETLIDADVEENLEKVEAARNGKRVLVKRSAAAAGRTTKELQYPSSSISFNALSNGSAAFDPVVDAWSTGVTPKDENLKSSKGNARHKNLSRKDRQKFRKELKDLKAAHHIELNNLKRKLSESRFQQRLTKLSCCTENTSWHNLTESPGDSGLQQKSK